MGTLLERIGMGEFVVSVQIDPPDGLNIHTFRKNIAQLQTAGVKVVDINVSRRVSLDPVSLAIELKKASLDVIPHLTTRDHTISGLQSQVLTGWALAGISDYLLIAGDLYTQLQSKASGIFGAPIVEGISELSKLRSKHRLGISFGAAINQYRNNISTEIRLIADKQEAGIDFFMSQPVFDDRQIDELLSLRRSDIRKPLLVGIWPILYAKTVSRIREGNIKGVVMPDGVYNEIQGFIDDAQQLRDWGIKRAVDLIDRLRRRREVAGVYVVAPRNPSLLTDLMIRVLA